MSCEALLVWRGGALVAEPTGGLPLLYEGSPPSRWWATVDVSLGTVPPDLPFCVEVDVLSELPAEGEIGRVRRVVGPATPTEFRDGTPSSGDVDRAFVLLERIPEDWLLYETRVGALPGLGWDAFVGTLLRVPEQTISAVLGGDWRSIIRIESWLRSADDPGTRSIEA